MTKDIAQCILTIASLTIKGYQQESDQSNAVTISTPTPVLEAKHNSVFTNIVVPSATRWEICAQT